MLPDKLRHDDVNTFQVPTTSPPQGDPLGQLGGWLVLPELPPLAGEPPLPPLPPDWLPPEPLLFPPEPLFVVVPPEPPLPPEVEVEHAEPRIQSEVTIVRSEARCGINFPQRESDMRGAVGVHAGYMGVVSMQWH